MGQMTSKVLLPTLNPSKPPKTATFLTPQGTKVKTLLNPSEGLASLPPEAITSLLKAE